MNRELFDKHFDRCEIKHIANFFDGSPELEIKAYWKGVDRPWTHSWITKSQALALRMQRAVTAGAVFEHVEPATDVNGQTYIYTSINILWRRANTELKRLGY